ncbi:hypothetical protein [Grimontia hollisae]|nr:hypothetical protein [Grimontia hollisae]
MKMGFYYPIFNGETGGINNHSVPIYTAFCDKPDEYHINANITDEKKLKEIVNNYKMEFYSILKSQCHVIISGEDISILPETALLHIKELILDAGFNLEVYCSIRKPYSMLCSELQQKIKSGNADLLNIKVTLRSVIVKKLLNVFGKSITFTSFESDCKKNGPVIEFLHRIGVYSDDVVIFTSNEGFGNISTRALAFLNIKFPIFKDGRIYGKRRKKFINSIDRSRFLLTKDEFYSVYGFIIHENSQYEKYLGTDYTDSEYQFSEPLDIELKEAINLIHEYHESHTGVELFKFLNNNSTVSFDILSDIFSQDADILRNMAIFFEWKGDIISASKYIKMAKSSRPNGPLINLKCQEYERLLE